MTRRRAFGRAAPLKPAGCWTGLAAAALLAISTAAQAQQTARPPEPQTATGAPLELAPEAGAADEGALNQGEADQAAPELDAPLREGDPVIDLDRARREDRGDPIDVAPTTEGTGAIVRGLDKFTGERATIEIAVDDLARFGRMRVEVRACLARVSARNAEASAFLQIYDEKEEPPLRVFSGWMFSTAPALSALDHPRFDFWVLRCST